MHAYGRELILGALILIGIAATIIVQGGWEAASAAFAIFTGTGFALGFARIRAVSERPRSRSRHPSWADAATPSREAPDREQAAQRPARDSGSTRSPHIPVPS